MKKVAITGTICSGKTFIVKMFEQNGIKSIISDDIIAGIYHKENVINWVRNNFPDCILDNQVNKKLLGDIVFQYEDEMDKLENYIIPIYKVELNEILKKYDEEILIVEIPLLFENRLEKIFDYIITVYCSDDVRKQRSLARGNLDIRKLENILKKQLPDKRKKLLSNFTLDSEENVEILKEKIKNIIARIKKA